jgi:putative effector of murein hydrolase LrgA (UPF0299 family)
MSRVWKHFLKNITVPVVFVAYVLFVIGGSQYLNHNYGEILALLFFSVTFVIPVVGWLVRDMWRDAKEKVEEENRDMMRRIRG